MKCPGVTGPDWFLQHYARHYGKSWLGQVSRFIHGLLILSSLVLFSPGLQSEHLPASEVERPAPCLQRVSRLLVGFGPVHVGLDLETRLVLRQRERRQFPRRHHREQAAEDLQGWNCSLQHQVRSGKTDNNKVQFWILIGQSELIAAAELFRRRSTASNRVVI